MTTRRAAVLFLALVLAQSSPALAREIPVQNRTDLQQALKAAQAGDLILIAPGDYPGGYSCTTLQGTAERPIEIGAADPARPPVISGGGGLHFSAPCHLILRDLVIRGATGNGLNVDDAGNQPGSARSIVLRNLVVTDVGPAGNRDGMKLSGLSDFRVEHCRVERWGAAGSAIDMVGCDHGVIQHCVFKEARGPEANAVQAKGGSQDIVIRRCRFHDAGGRGVNIGGSTGLPFFRPRDASFEARQITVEDCEFLGGMAPIAFVGVDGALVQHNTILNPQRWVFRILQESTDPRFVPCRNGRFENNLVVFRSQDLSVLANIGSMTSPESFSFRGNHWFCSDRPDATSRLVRLPTPEADGTTGIDPGLSIAENGHLQLAQPDRVTAGVRRPSGESGKK